MQQGALAQSSSELVLFNNKSEFCCEMLEASFGLWCAGRGEQLILGSLLPVSVWSLMDIVSYRSIPLPVVSASAQPPPIMFITSENTHSI